MRTLRTKTRKNCRCLLWPLLPLVFILRKTRLSHSWIQRISYFLDILVDYSAAIRLSPCDVAIGRWTVAYRSLQIAKKRFGAKIISDVGIKHPETEAQIVSRYGGIPGYHRSIKRNKEIYKIVDNIVVPAKHAATSFIEKGFSKEKIFKNPYGTDLEEFKATPKAPQYNFDIIFVGTWCIRKGCDLLVKSALEVMNLKVLHVGNVGDIPLPSSSQFTHIDPVPQHELRKYYSSAKIFVIPSRAEGLALVQAQAICAGLPIVYSSETGGADLKELVEDSPFMFEMKDFTVDALCESINLALKKAEEVPSVDGKRDYLGPLRNRLSWKMYGERYNTFLRSLFKLS